MFENLSVSRHFVLWRIWSLGGSSSPSSVSSIDLSVDWEVVVAKGKDSIMGVGKNGGKRFSSPPAWTVKHLGLEFSKLVLEVGEVVGEGLDDGWVPGSGHGFVGRSEILGPLQSWDIIGPEFCFLGQAGRLGIQIQTHVEFRIEDYSDESEGAA